MKQQNFAVCFFFVELFCQIQFLQELFKFEHSIDQEKFCAFGGTMTWQIRKDRFRDAADRAENILLKLRSFLFCALYEFYL